MFWKRLFDPRRHIIDLQGKVVIVTGGNRGTGYATIQHLLRGGAKVYMGARDEKKAKEAIEKLKKDESWKGKGEVSWLKLDLSDPREAKKAAEDFTTKEKRLDVLVNNAALLPDSPFEKTPDGTSSIVNVNYISPFVFTETLLPMMKSTALSVPDSDVRIVILSSKAHKHVPSSTKFEEVSDFCVEYKDRYLGALIRYGHTKLIEILWAKHLQNRLQSSNPRVPITVMAVHPGNVDTYSERLPLSWLWKLFMRLTTVDPERGAYTSVFAAASKAVQENKDLYKGVYLVPEGVIKKPSRMAEDLKLGEDLDRLTRKFLSEIGIKL
ncbi:short chain dehydrogenase [Moniliophthora roreri MCA 2997]|uniref:Short chain dehydrogenase n=1 Tax=Moniliophthora roreri (strain MCA 2997) TaxID=1381753 RepID=V2YF25_MONRO|nr:short chain dehydrogenase [Moniliophthora roreri MCA 2997]